MRMENTSFGRRTLLTGSLAAAALVPLASCATGGGTSSGAGSSAAASSADNPFGMASSGTIDAVIFNGGYKTDYVDFAGTQLTKKFPGVTVKVSPSTQIAQELQPRFVGGNPPDIVDNSGAQQIGMSTIVDQLEDLTSVLNANNYEGKKIADSVFASAIKASGTFNGKLAAMNYAMTVYAYWYSASLFKANNWTPPKTWAEALDLGAKAKAAGKYLLLFGKEAATYYLTTLIASAIMEGGDDVRKNFENLKPDCYSQQSVVDSFKGLEAIIKAGYMKPGGSGTQFTAAQSQWSNAQEALLYPSGGWIENEMKSQTKADFQMTGINEFTVTSSPKMPASSLHAEAGEPFIVPSKGKNVAGGKEVLRAMLSKDAATNFASTRLALTVVKGAAPAESAMSTALKSQSDLLSKAGNNTFSWQFISYYGLNKENLVVMNSFLEGQMSADDARKGLQGIVNKAAADTSKPKLQVS
ncbi:MAG: carbohydrate ABC transporter, N-acetylglucosamine/diacetylchitobiose-binding protein [Actinobacteria bacterium]|nr:carbohydrate ABC transporter, N-acetylglucosamine/diacetylchitobiose-binding protein [Actinomycetota bacterium]